MADINSDSFSFEDEFKDLAGTSGSSSGPGRWKMIALVEGVVIVLLVLGILVGLGINFLPNLFGPSPEDTVAAYYATLESQDYASLSKYYDVTPGSDSTLVNLMPMTGELINQLENFIGEQVGLNVQLGMDFQNLTYTVLAQTRETASIKVTGQVRVYEVNLNLGGTLPYEWTHELIKRNGHWYLRP